MAVFGDKPRARSRSIRGSGRDELVGRFVAKGMGVTTCEVNSTLVPMTSHPSLVIDVIRIAANAVHWRFTAA